MTEDRKGTVSAASECRQLEPGSMEGGLSGLTGEDLVATREALEEQARVAKEMLERDEKGVLSEYDKAMAEEGRAALEEQKRSEAQRISRYLVNLDTEGQNRARQQIRELMSGLDKQAEVVEMPPVSEMPRLPRYAKGLSKNGMNQRIFKNRATDKRSKLFGFRGFGVYAVDKVTARELVELRTEVKPKWAVHALVVLRDAGECQVCTNPAHPGGVVKQLVPVAMGGQCSEPNCVLVCKLCALAWPTRNYFLSSAVEFHFWELALGVLRRRMLGKSRSRPLNAKGLEQMELLRTRLDRATVEMHKALDKAGQSKVVIDKNSCLLV